MTLFNSNLSILSMNVSNEHSGKVPKSKGKNINIPIGTSSDKNLVGLDSMQSSSEGTTEIKVYGNTQFTITQNADGTKTVKYKTVNDSSQDKKLIEGEYSVDDNGNVFAKLKNGGKVSISTAEIYKSNWGQETTIKLTDKDNNEVTIPVRLANDFDEIAGYSNLSKNEKLQIVLGNLTSAISNLTESTLSDLKSEVRVLKLEKTLKNDAAAGLYNSDDTISLSVYSTDLSSDTLTHEIGHAVDDNVDSDYQTNGNGKYKFNKLINLLKQNKTFGDAYALTNNKEFFAEYYAFQEGKGQEKTKQLLNYLENLSDSTPEQKELKNAYNEVKNICDSIIQNTRKSPIRVREKSEYLRQLRKGSSEELIEKKEELKNKFGLDVRNDGDLIDYWYSYVDNIKTNMKNESGNMETSEGISTAEIKEYLSNNSVELEKFEYLEKLYGDIIDNHNQKAIQNNQSLVQTNQEQLITEKIRAITFDDFQTVSNAIFPNDLEKYKNEGAKYDFKNGLSTTESIYKGNTIVRVYNKAGNIISVEVRRNGKQLDFGRYTYNSNGSRTLILTNSADGSVSKTQESFDEKGNMKAEYYLYCDDGSDYILRKEIYKENGDKEEKQQRINILTGEVGDYN